MAAFAEAHGVRLLPIFRQTDLGLTFEVLQSTDARQRVVFGPGLGNLDDAEYVEDAGTVGVAVAAGKGEGTARLQRFGVTADEFTRAFGVLAETYVDRRDTEDLAELDKAVTEALGEGVAARSFRCTALETPGTRYGQDFDLNTLATVSIGPPGVDPDTGRPYRPVAVFDDMVRELHFAYDSTGQTSDRVTAAVGTESASTGVTLPSLRKLAALDQKVTRLQRSP